MQNNSLIINSLIPLTDMLDGKSHSLYSTLSTMEEKAKNANKHKLPS